MSRHVWQLLSVTVTCVLVSHVALAQAKKDAPTVDTMYVDFSVPDLPALAALGLNPNKVTQPGTLKELSVAAFPIVAGDASIGPGVAVAWAPVYTFARSLDDYRKPILRRLAVSLVTAKDGTTAAINVGAGFRVVLVDRADPAVSPQAGLACQDRRKDDYECSVLAILASEDGPTKLSQKFQQNEAVPVLRRVAAAMSTDAAVDAQLIASLLTPWDLRNGPTPFTADGQRRAFNKALEGAARDAKLPVPRLDEALSKEVDDLGASFLTQAVVAASSITARLTQVGKTYREAHGNSVFVNLDAGIVGRSATGNWSDLKGKVFGTLLSASLPLGTRAQLLTQVQGRSASGTVVGEKSYVGSGVRLLVGTSTRRFSIEGFGAHVEDADAARTGTASRFTVGTEFRVSSGFWMELAFGTERKPETMNSHLLSLANFKYAFKSKPRFSEIPGSVQDDE
jgi:hypothetical protein